MDTIHLLTISSNVYAKQTAVMLTSLLENKNSFNDIKIYILNGNISNENRSKLNKSIERFGVNIDFLPLDETLFEDFKLTFAFSKENYFRVMAPTFFSKDVQKLIILDSDIIIKDDITDLWNIDISNYYLAAVEDLAAGPRQYELSMPLDSSYFNSGVLLVNLDKWRQDSISIKVMEYIKNNPSKILWLDQDALNALLYDKWLKIDKRWNYQTVYIGSEPLNPSIIHYTGYNKPWNMPHPLEDEYYKYEKRTLWEQD